MCILTTGGFVKYFVKIFYFCSPTYGKIELHQAYAMITINKKPSKDHAFHVGRRVDKKEIEGIEKKTK